jgi:integrase
VTLALTTGARYSELATLTWEQLDLDADFGLSPTMRLTVTKSGWPRTVPLMADAVAALAVREPDPAKRCGPVFRLEGSSIRKAFDKALERAGIAKGTDPTTRVSFHTLRHTAASWLTIKGATLRSVQEILGHATPAQTARYSHLGCSAHTCGPGPPDRPREPRSDGKRRHYGTAYGTIGRSRRLTMRHYWKAPEILSF